MSATEIQLTESEVRLIKDTRWRKRVAKCIAKIAQEWAAEMQEQTANCPFHTFDMEALLERIAAQIPPNG
jgi:hypothetical protein